MAAPSQHRGWQPMTSRELHRRCRCRVSLLSGRPGSGPDAALSQLPQREGNITRDEEREHTSTGGMPRQERRSYLPLDRFCGLALNLLGRPQLGFLLPGFGTEHSKTQSPVQVAAGAAWTGTFSLLRDLYHGSPALPLPWGPCGPL